MDEKKRERRDMRKYIRENEIKKEELK